MGLMEEVLKIALPVYTQKSKQYSSNVPTPLRKDERLSSIGQSYQPKHKLNKYTTYL